MDEKIGSKLSFNISDLIKKGRYGKVFQGTYQGCKAVAIKRLDKSETEVDIKAYMDVWGHANIIQLFCIKTSHPEFMFIVTVLCAGTLEDLVDGSYTGPAVGDNCEVLRQITTGLDFLHRFEIVHGDLKPTNVLISHPVGNDRPVMKLTDFGLRHVLRQNGSDKRFQPAHTKGWYCHFDKEGDKALDQFSLGCLCYFTLFQGVHPFGETKEKRINRIAARQPIILPTDQQRQAVADGFAVIWEMIIQLLDYNSVKRPTTSQILTHPYFCSHQFVLRRPENVGSGQNLTAPELQSSVFIPSTSTPRFPNGEASAKKMRNEHLQQPVSSYYSHPSLGVFNFPRNNPYRNDFTPLTPNEEQIDRLQETSFASPLDLRLGAEPFSYNRTSIGMFYPPPPPPPPIRPSDPTFDPTFDGLASRSGQSASLPQQSDEIRVMQPFFTNSSQPIENPTCFGISPIPKSPRNWDNEQMRSPLSTGGKTEQEESVIQPNVKIQASTPLREEVPLPDALQEEQQPDIQSPPPIQQRMVAMKSTSKQCLNKRTHQVESQQVYDLSSESEDSEDDIFFVGEVIHKPVDLDLPLNLPISIEDIKMEGATMGVLKIKDDEPDVQPEAENVWVPLNVLSPNFLTPEPDTAPLTLESTTASLGTQSPPPNMMTSPSDVAYVEEESVSLYDSSSSSSEAAPENPSQVPKEEDDLNDVQPEAETEAIPQNGLSPNFLTPRPDSVSLTLESTVLPLRTESPPPNMTPPSEVAYEVEVSYSLYDSSSPQASGEGDDGQDHSVEKVTQNNVESEANVPECSSSSSTPASLSDYNQQQSPMKKTLAFAKLCECREFTDDQMILFRQFALDEEVNVNHFDSEGLTPLLNLTWNHRSIRLYECIKILLSRPDLDINVKEMDERANALAMVCRYYSGHKLYDIVELLLDHKIQLDSKNKNDENALMGLCINYKKENIADIVRLLLSQPAVLQSLNAVNKDMGWNALVLLCYHYSGRNLLDVARFLLEQGIQIDTECNKNDNALVAVCSNYKQDSLLDVVKLLIDSKIDVNWRNPTSGRNALISLCKNYSGYNLEAIVKVLVDAGIDLDAQNSDGQNCLLALAEKKNRHPAFYSIIEHLIKKKIDLNAVEKDGMNILIYLSQLNGGGKLKKSMVELLIRNGIDVNARTKTGYNILLSLAQNHNPLRVPTPNDNRDFIAIIQLLVQKSIDVNQKNEEDMNALHLLCKFYRGTNIADVVRILVATKIESAAMDKQGHTPEYYFRQRKFRNKIDVIQLLTKK